MERSIPLAVGKTPKGYLTLQDRAVLAAAVNTIKEEHDQIVKLQKQITGLQQMLKVQRAANTDFTDRVADEMGWK